MFSRFERQMAYRYLRSSRQEGFISITAWFSFIGIALGVATLIIVMSVMNGFREELLSKIIGMNGHMAILAKQHPFTNFEEIAQKVKGVEGVVAVYPNIERQAMLLYRNQARGVQIHGITPQDLKSRQIISTNILEGTLDGFGHFDHEGEVTETIAIGIRLATKLALKVGDRVSIVSPEGNASAFGTLPRQKSFQIAAIFAAGVNDYDTGVIFMPLASAQNFFKLGQGISNLEIYIDNPEKVAQRGLRIRAAIGDDYQIFDWQNANNSLFEAVVVERNVMFIILTLIILIAAFNILSTLIMLVKDKTRDIGIMRTMGASQNSIMKIFFLTGTTLGVVGTILGLTLGLAFATNVENMRGLLEKITGTQLFNAEIYFLTQLPSKVNVIEVILIVVISLLLTVLSTLYPSWRAARLDPVEALRQ